VELDPIDNRDSWRTTITFTTGRATHTLPNPVYQQLESDTQAICIPSELEDRAVLSNRVKQFGAAILPWVVMTPNEPGS